MMPGGAEATAAGSAEHADESRVNTSETVDTGLFSERGSAGWEASASSEPTRSLKDFGSTCGSWAWPLPLALEIACSTRFAARMGLFSERPSSRRLFASELRHLCT